MDEKKNKKKRINEKKCEQIWQTTTLAWLLLGSHGRKTIHGSEQQKKKEKWLILFDVPWLVALLFKHCHLIHQVFLHTTINFLDLYSNYKYYLHSSTYRHDFHLAFPLFFFIFFLPLFNIKRLNTFFVSFFFVYSFNKKRWLDAVEWQMKIFLKKQ